MRIVLPYFLLMDQVDQPGSLILVDLFEQMVDVQSESARIGQHICQQLCWIFCLEPLELELFVVPVGASIAD